MEHNPMVPKDVVIPMARSFYVLLDHFEVSVAQEFPHEPDECPTCNEAIQRFNTYMANRGVPPNQEKP